MSPKIQLGCKQSFNVANTRVNSYTHSCDCVC